MKKKMIIFDIDSVCRLLQDYCGEIGFPNDGKPVKLMFHPGDQKLGIVVESEEWNGEQASEQVKFDIHRVYTHGSVN
jgi:hypothetical protein